MLPNNAPIAAAKLIRDKKVCCVFGSSLTACCNAMFPIIEAEQVPNVALAGGRDVIVPFKKWVFTTTFPD